MGAQLLERPGRLALTEGDAGTDVQRLKRTAKRHGEGYVINGSKMWITNGRCGNTFVLAAKTQTQADLPYQTISAFIIKKGAAGFNVMRDIDTLGYRGVENCELSFDNFFVPGRNLVGGRERRNGSCSWLAANCVRVPGEPELATQSTGLTDGPLCRRDLSAPP
jgi:alkylation response protein AidB-like acyl-CoA dehydrogenase